MSLTNPNTPVSQQDLQDFYHKILPYMGGSSEGGGHTIEDAEGTDLTQRDTLQFGEGLSATDDSTNEKTVVDIDPMPAEDMDEVISPLPSVQSRYHKYSTEEHIVGEWIDGKTLYEKTIDCGNLPNSATKKVDTGLLVSSHAIKRMEGTAIDTNGYTIPLPFVSVLNATSQILLDVDIDSGTPNYVIRLITGNSGKTSMVANVTLQYTKSE